MQSANGIKSTSKKVYQWQVLKSIQSKLEPSNQLTQSLGGVQVLFVTAYCTTGGSPGSLGRIHEPLVNEPLVTANAEINKQLKSFIRSVFIVLTLILVCMWGVCERYVISGMLISGML